MTHLKHLSGIRNFPSMSRPSKNTSKSKELITLTFGDMAENHKGMEQIGKMVAPGEGFHLPDLQDIQQKMEAIGVACELVQLSDEEKPDAYVLVMRDAVNQIFHEAKIDAEQIHLFEEQKGLEYDTKAFMYGRVVNKHARWNLCFDEESRAPDYANGKGRIIGYNEVPLLQTFMEYFEQYFGKKSANLKVESNYYYDSSKCGIGFHGDSERRKVIAMRIGVASLPMHYQWYKDGEAVGDQIIIPLNAGDMYIMDEKAVGTDWKRKTIYTLRHATGASKYVSKSSV